MAPSAGYVVTDGLPDRILTCLGENAGQGMRLADLSRALYPDAASRQKATLEVGAALSRMHKTGRVQRVQTPPGPGRTRPFTFYYLPIVQQD